MRSKRHQIYMLLTGDILAASTWGAHPLLYNKPRTEKSASKKKTKMNRIPCAQASHSKVSKLGSTENTWGEGV